MEFHALISLVQFYYKSVKNIYYERSAKTCLSSTAFILFIQENALPDFVVDLSL